MLHIQLHKLEMSGTHCANRECKHDTKYMVNILGHVWHIKVDTTVAIVSLQGKQEVYCRGCIPDLYQMIKGKLDPKLWAFH